MRDPVIHWSLRLLCTLAVLSTASCQSCRRDAGGGTAPGADALRPYDFKGHTALKLKRICQAAEQASGDIGARRQLLCARTLLDWYLVATLREDPSLITALEDFLGISSGPSRGVRHGGAKILTRIQARFTDAARRSRGPSLRRIAKAGADLVQLQLTESRRWGYAYLKGLRTAARTGAPFEVQARVIIAGAALDGLKTLSRAAGPQRRELLVQGLGFACPAEAEASRGLETKPRPPDCPLACPGLRAAIYRLPPVRRKALVAAQCPLSYLGLSQRAHGIYLSAENLLVTRSVSFQLQNLARLRSLGQHPLVRALRGARGTLAKRLGSLRVPLDLPELSPGEPVHFPLPLCASADEHITAPVYLAIDETRLFAGPIPVLGVRQGRITFLDYEEGYPFPGRRIRQADPATVRTLLARLRRVFRRITAGKLPVHPDRVALYADSHLSVARLNDLLDLLSALGITRAELVLRNSHQALRVVPITVAVKRRGEGPPLTVPPTPPLPPRQAPLRLQLNPVFLRLEAQVGPLKKAPLQIPAGDLAGLRETLEKTRRAYRSAQGVEVSLSGQLSYREVARLLHHLRRNSSGRTLYSTLIL